MPKFVIYEVWTRATVMDATDEETALLNHSPNPEDLNLCNWHAVPVDTMLDQAASYGALNYTQVD